MSTSRFDPRCLRVSRPSDMRLFLLASIIFVLFAAGCTGANTADGAIVESAPDPCNVVGEPFLASILGGQASGPSKTEHKRSSDCGWWTGPSKRYPRGAVFGIFVWKEGFGDQGTAKERTDQARRFYSQNTFHQSAPCTRVNSNAYDACWGYQPGASVFFVDFRNGNVVVTAYWESFRIENEIPKAAQTATQIAEELARRM